jgi:uncharacterized repeat protein (TIGR03943 family)
VRRDVQAVVLVLVGAALLRITLAGDMYLRYVKAGLRPALVAAGVIVLLLGLVGVVRDGLLRAHEREGGHAHDDETEGHEDHAADRARRGGRAGRGRHAGHGGHGDGDDHGHDHSRGPRVAWLMCLPVLALFLVAPPALGAYTAARSANAVVRPATVDAGFPELPPGDPLEMTPGEFSVRAVWDTAEHIKGRNVAMLGFVTPGADGTWYLTRMTLSCCAADARTFKIEMRGAAAPPADTWVRVTGTWLPNGKVLDSEAIPAFTVATLERVPAPKDPYE